MWGFNFFGSKKNKEVKKVVLKEPGWHPIAKQKLERLIEAASGQILPVVLDMDNTILCRDIGEATFAFLESEGKISTQNIPDQISPAFIFDQEMISLKQSYTLYDYYHKLIVATSHHHLDTAKELVGYTWAVAVLQGLTPLEIIQATEHAFYKAEVYKHLKLPAEIACILHPFFYPEMIELIGVLLEHEYDVWVISSSNTWSVRWVLLKALDLALRNRGYEHVLKPTHVMGINTILISDDKKMYKDNFLVYDNPDYANLDPATLSKYRTTALVVPPAAASYGKVAQIMQWIGKPPYLVAGDSSGDIPMLKYAQNRLWIAKLEIPESHEYLAPLTLQKQQEDTWIIQPTLFKHSPGFISSNENLRSRSDIKDLVEIQTSLDIFNSYGLLLDFNGP